MDGWMDIFLLTSIDLDPMLNSGYSVIWSNRITVRCINVNLLYRLLNRLFEEIFWFSVQTKQ